MLPSLRNTVLVTRQLSCTFSYGLHAGLHVACHVHAVHTLQPACISSARARACRARGWCSSSFPARLALLCCAGVFPGMLLLPHVKSERFEWFQAYCALASSFVLLVGAPVFIYTVRFVHMSCP